MLPIIDYGGIAIVVPKISAVGGVVHDGDKYGFEVYLSGMEEPLNIGFESEIEASEARDELVAIIAQYHYTSEFGPDFEIEDLNELIDEEIDDDVNDKNEKH